MQQKSGTNHGEGNPEAAERFNTAEQNFVQSKRGQDKIKEGPKVRPQEQTELSKAESVGRSHAKDDTADSM